jgi:hypothetical protein
VTESEAQGKLKKESKKERKKEKKKDRKKERQEGRDKGNAYQAMSLKIGNRRHRTRRLVFSV